MKVASQRLGLWCSRIFVALTAIGWLGIAHLHMPARRLRSRCPQSVVFRDASLGPPVIIWGAYITLTTWYTLTEPRRAPERLEIPEPMGRT
jgi:hypothetical protein